jgi:hypothetical protein
MFLERSAAEHIKVHFFGDPWLTPGHPQNSEK